MTRVCDTHDGWMDVCIGVCACVTPTVVVAALSDLNLTSAPAQWGAPSHTHTHVHITHIWAQCTHAHTRRATLQPTTTNQILPLKPCHVPSRASLVHCGGPSLPAVLSGSDAVLLPSLGFPSGWEGRGGVDSQGKGGPVCDGLGENVDKINKWDG